MDRTVLFVADSKEIKEVPIDPKFHEDPFYRYKMSQLQIQIIGRGKMIKTTFLNIESVSRSLNIPPTYIPNYIAKTNGSKVIKSSVSGKYDIERLDKILCKFIEEFVLCKQCRHPELSYSPRTNDCRIRCQSCGYSTRLTKMNVNSTFIRWACKHLPPKTVRHNKQKTKKQKTRPKKKCQMNGWSLDTSEEAVNQRSQEIETISYLL